MHIECSFIEDVAVLRLVGELDMATAEILNEKTAEVKADYSKIVFDFAELTFVDSTGVGNLIKLLRDNDDLEYAISNLNREIQEIFDILNLKEILGEKTLVESNEKAFELLAGQ